MNHPDPVRAAQVIAAAHAEIIAGGAAQQAARLVIRRVIERDRRHRQRDLVRASLTATAGHDIGGPRRHTQPARRHA